MRCSLALQCASLAVLALAPIQVRAQTIGVYRDPNAVECPVIPLLVPTTVYVVATLAPAACGGIAGVGFRLQGWPQSWFYFVNSGPVIPPIGDLFNAGYYLAWSQCRTSESGVVPVFSFQVIATSVVSDVPVSVTHPAAASPPFLCPVVALCDEPVYTLLCATSVETRVNPNPSMGFCPCQAPCYSDCPPIGVEPSSWAQIKRLYD